MGEKIFNSYQKFFTADSIDDLLHYAYNEIIKHGIEIQPTKGSALELCGITLELKNPLARLSRSETRSRLFSALGEFFWYMSKTNKVDFIKYYVPMYSMLAEGDSIYGGYGPRFFNWDGHNQFLKILDILQNKENSRQAVIQIFDASDLLENHKDVPCTCNIQFLLRENRLNVITFMRSNDMYLGFPHDIFCFTMIQELFARILKVDLGTYTHIVGSMHLYKENLGCVENYLNEGFQSTQHPMQTMPELDPIYYLSKVQEIETSLRQGIPIDKLHLSDLPEYWSDISLLLAAFRELKNENKSSFEKIRNRFSSDVYRGYLNTKLSKI